MWIYCKSCFWIYWIFNTGYIILLIVTFWSPSDKNKNLLKLVHMLGTLRKNTLTKNTSLSIFSNWSILRKSLLCHLLPSLPPQTNVLDNSKKIFFWQLFTIFGSPWNLGRKKLKAVGHSFQKIYHVPWSTGALWRSRDTAQWKSESVTFWPTNQQTAWVGSRDDRNDRKVKEARRSVDALLAGEDYGLVGGQWNLCKPWQPPLSSSWHTHALNHQKLYL